MDTFAIKRSRVDELTTVEMALKVYHKDEFLSIKRELLGDDFDEDVQSQIWKDYHELMNKAACGGFEEGDFERLEFYRDLVGHWDLASDAKWLYFPTEIGRDESGDIVGVSLDTLDNEIVKRWFGHAYLVLIGKEVVRECAAMDCPNLFLHHGNKKFCSESCRNRDWQKKKR